MSTPTIVVGVTEWQPDSVAGTGLALAARLNARVLFVTVDTTRRLVETRPDGGVVAESIDSDTGDVILERFDPGLKANFRRLAATVGVPFEVLASAGNPSLTLAEVAEQADAVMIVVGTRKTTIGSSVREFFSGSVAVSLAHRQHRPVLVVPVDPVPMDTQLPWEGVTS